MISQGADGSIVVSENPVNSSEADVTHSRIVSIEPHEYVFVSPRGSDCTRTDHECFSQIPISDNGKGVAPFWIVPIIAEADVDSETSYAMPFINGICQTNRIKS